ncbi:MAG: nucleotide exchange factor GrpE [Rickettsiales bacterium]|jgi:molecular chaperone GrpE|nr:nucleotide exchange factor GrpE [Rickettsiales bacterium]
MEKETNISPEVEKDDFKDKYLRAMAELENTRKRASVDAENAARARAISVAAEFLPLVDAIDAAATHAPDDDGIRSLKKASDGTLAKLGIVRVETTGAMMNPQFHNVVMTEPSDAAANTITREMQSGFMFGDVVLRPAMVAVAANAVNQKKDESGEEKI